MLSIRSKPAKLMRAADAARDSRAWDKAVRLYGRVTAIDPMRTAAWVQLGNCAKEAKDFSLASYAYARALSLDPKNPDTYLQLGHLKKITGNIVDALWAYARSNSLGGPADANVEIKSIIANFDGLHHPDGRSLGLFVSSSVHSFKAQDMSLILSRASDVAESATLAEHKLDFQRRVSLMRFNRIFAGG